MLEINHIYNADCLDLMKEIPDKSIDLVLTDPPYNVGLDYNTHNDNMVDVEWRLFIDNFMKEILRISKRSLITCGQDNIFYYPKSDWIIAWVNPAGNNQNRWGFTCWQPVLCYGKDIYRTSGMGARQDIIQHNESSEKNFHPCPKPIKFWQKLLLRGSITESDIILDPFSGSGTTAIACHNLRRNFICIEKDPEYHRKSVERYNKHILQQNLF